MTRERGNSASTFLASVDYLFCSSDVIKYAKLIYWSCYNILKLLLLFVLGLFKASPYKMLELKLHLVVRIVTFLLYLRIGPRNNIGILKDFCHGIALELLFLYLMFPVLLCEHDFQLLRIIWLWIVIILLSVNHLTSSATFSIYDIHERILTTLWSSISCCSSITGLN